MLNILYLAPHLMSRDLHKSMDVRKNYRKSQLDVSEAAQFFDFLLIEKMYLENKVDSFVEREILYRMSLKRDG